LNREDVIHEFTRKYHHTFVQANPDGEFDLYFLSVRGTDITLENTEKGRFTTFFGGTVEFRYNYPRYGYFEHEGQVYSIWRHPDRQWSRGICNKNHILVFPNGKPSLDGFNEQMIRDSFVDAQATPEQIIKGQDGVLNKCFAIQRKRLMFCNIEVCAASRAHEYIDKIMRRNQR
jgi:hypothetical protein